MKLQEVIERLEYLRELHGPDINVAYADWEFIRSRELEGINNILYVEWKDKDSQTSCDGDFYSEDKDRYPLILIGAL